MPTKEREAVLKAIEEAPPAIKEAPILVQDTERIGSLPKEVEYLKVIFHTQLMVFALSWYASACQVPSSVVITPLEVAASF